MTARRLTFAALIGLSFAGLATLMTLTLSPGGYTALDLFILVCFMITLPRTIIGFWNAVIGLLIMRLSRNPADAVCPIEHGDPTQPLRSSTALLSCVRNEDTESLETNLNAIVSHLIRAGEADRFTLYVLSDTNMDDVALLEQQMTSRLKDRFEGQMEVVYRRRTDNRGFKAGNIEDFCERWAIDTSLHWC